MSETEVTTEVQVVDTENLDEFTSTFFGEKPEVEPAAKQESEQEEVPAQTEGEEDSAQTTDELTDEDEAAAEAELANAPKKSKVQERIDELVKQREDAKREAAAQIVQLRKEFEEKLAALKPAQPTVKAAEPTPDSKNEDGSDKYPLGEFDPLYIRDLTRYTLEEERTQANIRAEEQRRANEQEAAAAALQSSWNEKLVTAKEKYPDLAEKGQQLLDGFADLNQDYAGYLATVLMSMDYGPDVLHYLSNNQDEARKIVNSGAQKATLALGRIEAKFAEVEAQKVIAKPVVSKAPPPPPVQARGTAGGTKTIEPDTDDLDAFTDVFFAKNKRRA